jgi:hypothetical protein
MIPVRREDIEDDESDERQEDGGWHIQAVVLISRRSSPEEAQRRDDQPTESQEARQAQLQPDLQVLPFDRAGRDDAAGA